MLTHASRLAIATAIVVALASAARADVTLLVDDDGPADGIATFDKIGDALKFAKANVPDGEKVVIRVKEGVYEELLEIDRSDTCLVAESEPQFDRDGYLEGFARPVTILAPHRLAWERDIVRITADRVEIRGFIVDGAGKTPEVRNNGGIHATGHVDSNFGERILRGIVVAECEVRRLGDTGFWFSQTEGRIERCCEVGDSFLGILSTGADAALGPLPQVDVVKNRLARSELNICLVAQAWDILEGPQHGDGGHSAAIVDNLLLDARPYVGAFAGHHLQMLLRGASSNSRQDARGTLRVEFRGNRLGACMGAAIHVFPGGNATPEASGLIEGIFSKNAFLPGALPPLGADVTMAIRFQPGEYVRNHAFIFRDDRNGIFSYGVEIDEGPPESGNLILIDGPGRE